MAHIPVLLDEVIKYLDPKKGETILDATLHGGGHSGAIIPRLLPGGKLIGIDQDRQLLDKLISSFSRQMRDPAVAGQFSIFKKDGNLILVNDNFRNLDKILKSLKIKFVDGILFDLGMSSEQLENSGKGFSFLRDEPLIMTYKSELGPEDITAGDILNKWPEEEIFKVLKEYGEERYAGRISRNIAKRRKEIPFATTFDLVEVIKKSVPHGKKRQRINPATRTFQALRIAVNDELNALAEGLEKSWELLNRGGRLVVISFHSLEDRMVKNFFKEKKNEGAGNILTKKPISASEQEIKINPRSRSAKLRAIVKL